MRSAPVADTDESEIISELEAMKEWDNDFDIWAVVTGDYSEFDSAYGAEAALGYVLHFNWRKKSVVARALEVINQNWERNDGLPRIWAEDAEWYWYLMSLEVEEHKTDPYKEYHDWRRNQSQQEIEAAFWEVCDSGGGHEVYAHPSDIAEQVDIEEWAVRDNLEQMDEYEKVKDPTQSGRGRPRMVFSIMLDKL